MRVRLHRGGFDESMATTKTISPNLEELTAFFTRDMLGVFVPFNIEVSKHGPASDHRNGWDTHIVTGDIEGLALRVVLGYTDGPLPRELPKVCGRVLSMVEILAAKASPISRRRLTQAMGVFGYVQRLKMPMASGKSYRLVRVKSLRAAQYDTKPVLLISDDSIRTLQIKSFIKEQGWEKFLKSTELGEVIPFSMDLLAPVEQRGGALTNMVYVTHSSTTGHTNILGYLK